MGWLSRLVVGLILSWAFYSFYSIYQAVDIPKPAIGEVLLSNRIQIGQEFDLHLYVSSKPDLPFSSFKLVQDPDLPSRIIPSVTKKPCSPNSAQSVFHLLSFRVRYQSNGRFSYFKPHQFPPQFVSSCTYETGVKAKLVHHAAPSQDVLQFTIPQQLSKRLVPLYLATVGTRLLTTNESPADLRDVTLFEPTVERLTISLTPDVFKSPKRYLIRDPTKELQLQLLQQHGYTVSDSLFFSDGNTILQQLPSITLISAPHEVTVSPVLCHQPLSRSGIVALHLEELIVMDSATYQYYPPLSLNSLTSPRDEFIPLLGQSVIDIAGYGEISNRTTETSKGGKISVAVKYKPMGLRAWLLQNTMIHSLSHLESGMGFSSYDVDSFKLMMGGGNPILVSLTFIISVLHLLFSFLAVSANISYWNEDYELAASGTSHLSIVLEIIFSIFIALHLRDIGQSKFVLLTVVARIIFYLWKLWKIWKFREIDGKKTKDAEKKLLLAEDEKSSGTRKRGSVQSEKDEVENDINWPEILEFETNWMKRLCLLLLPVVLSVMIYQLICVPQNGWKSWIIHSLALCSYAGGFVAMTPQLFRNYKLQSVDHLPWATLTYQALNAFVDDFFSFIIRMPTMHRVSVFRDDIIFITYMVQRWMYRHKKKALEKVHVD